MKTNTHFHKKTSIVFILGCLTTLLYSCGSYQNSSYYDNDGIYSEQNNRNSQSSQNNSNSNQYKEYFRDIRGAFNMYNIIMTHIPIHQDCVGRFKLNAHGHLHSNIIKDKDGNKDERYFNCCVEQNNFFPFNLDEIITR